MGRCLGSWKATWKATLPPGANWACAQVGSRRTTQPKCLRHMAPASRPSRTRGMVLGDSGPPDAVVATAVYRIKVPPFVWRQPENVASAGGLQR